MLLSYLQPGIINRQDMNIEQAKQIPLAALVQQLGGRFARRGRKGESWWYSPFRPEERTASFVIHEIKNEWHDFARTEKKDAHGDILDLWTDYHNKPRRDSAAISQALKELEILFGGPIITLRQSPLRNIPQKRSPDTSNDPPRYRLVKDPGPVRVKKLRTELARRGLSPHIVAPYLKQGNLEDTKTGKHFNAFAFENDQHGWEISLYNPGSDYSFRICIGHKAPTSYMQGSFNTVMVFESRWDFFTWLEIVKGNTEGYGFIIANGVSMAYSVAEILAGNYRGIERIVVFQHNDPVKENASSPIPPGEKFTQALIEILEPYDLTIETVNDHYKDYKDLNEWWIIAPEARRSTNFIKQPDLL